MTRNLLTATAVALLLGAASLGAGTANAAVGIGINLGDVSLGFSDGYWDSHHHWHRWAHRGDAARWRTAHADMYHDWRHDDPNHR